MEDQEVVLSTDSPEVVEEQNDSSSGFNDSDSVDREENPVFSRLPAGHDGAFSSPTKLLLQKATEGEEYEPSCVDESIISVESAYVPTSIASGSGVCEEESTSFNVIQQVEDEAGWNPYREGTPDLDELKARASQARLQRVEQRAQAKAETPPRLEGVGGVLAKLRGSLEGVEENTGAELKQRIVLDAAGRVIEAPFASSMKRNAHGPAMVNYSAQDMGKYLDLELPAGPPHPTDPEGIRRVVRSKMPRCKVCRSRYGERNLLERHLRDNHYVEYLEYIAAQEEEIQLQKLEEQEMNRMEELATGGFIPPEGDLVAENFDVDINRIPLPGELSNGIPARFDRNGILRQPRRPYRKKISPQCPFCDKRFRNEVSLKKHFQKKHPECVEFVQCLDCFKCLPGKEELETHHCDLSFICFECTPMRNLCTPHRLFMHRAKFHRGANSGFRCNECNLKFLTPRKLRKHKKMAHVFTKTYGCHFCEELFTSEVTVVTHERMHTGIIKFECLICDFRCNRYIEMEAHKREEHGYLCSICRKPFAEWAEIKNHTLMEHGGYLTSESGTGYIESPRVFVMYKGD